MITALLIVAAFFLAWSNGANDNFKGVASLFGSGTTGYRTALCWATVTTLLGSLASILLAQTLLKRFSGKGLVPDALASSEPFLAAVALGAGATVLVATITGFPISTTHAITGALLGAGVSAAGSAVRFATLGRAFLLPLIVSPLIAIALGGGFYLAFRYVRLRLGVTKDWCVCVGAARTFVPVPQPASLFDRTATTALPEVCVGSDARCIERYNGRYFGINAQQIMQSCHFLSAGLVSFARGLNDTPKMAGLLLIIPLVDARSALAAIGVAIALGGLIAARRVAETMSHRITGMNQGQGFSANLATATLVSGASYFGLPVSTTHVSVGALFGIGLTTRQAHLPVVRNVVLSWIVTLPFAALCAGGAWLVIY